mmetsp:Transcript_44320/g.134330  ORF Transcript_44320/g.134330 Transcript_44320/m.134330 type:complete len:403 (+) Transcript_44320:1819-3027(+)
MDHPRQQAHGHDFGRLLRRHHAAGLRHGGHLRDLQAAGEAHGRRHAILEDLPLPLLPLPPRLLLVRGRVRDAQLAHGDRPRTRHANVADHGAAIHPPPGLGDHHRIHALVTEGGKRDGYREHHVVVHARHCLCPLRRRFQHRPRGHGDLVRHPGERRVCRASAGDRLRHRPEVPALGQAVRLLHLPPQAGRGQFRAALEDRSAADARAQEEGLRRFGRPQRPLQLVRVRGVRHRHSGRLVLQGDPHAAVVHGRGVHREDERHAGRAGRAPRLPVAGRVLHRAVRGACAGRANLDRIRHEHGVDPGVGEVAREAADRRVSGASERLGAQGPHRPPAGVQELWGRRRGDRHGQLGCDHVLRDQERRQVRDLGRFHHDGSCVHRPGGAKVVGAADGRPSNRASAG